MPIRIVQGDITEATEHTICHQVNCQGRMKSGVAAAIRKKWPRVYTDYKDWLEIFKKRNESPLGTNSLTFTDDGKLIVNMFAQDNYGYDGRRYTSYDAFWLCLNKIKYYAAKDTSIAFPYGIGCGLGGANWHIIYTMIEEVLSKDYDITLYKLKEIEE